MFGYLRLYKDTLTLQQRKIYRDYYCSSCLALKQNYGRVARFLLSYDIGYVALILFPRTMKLEPCGKLRKTYCKSTFLFSTGSIGKKNCDVRDASGSHEAHRQCL